MTSAQRTCSLAALGGSLDAGGYDLRHPAGRRDLQSSMRLIRLAFTSVMVAVAVGALIAGQPLVASGQSAQSLPLQAGWQLVSLPVVPGNTAPSAVLASITSQLEEAQAFDGCSASPARVFDPTASSDNTLTSIDPSIGVWVKMTAPASLSLSGTAPTTTSMHLCSGMNLVGYPLPTELPVSTVLSPIAGKFSRVYGYSAARPNDPWEIFDVSVPDFANTLQTMKPGRGYFILATADTTLTLGSATPPSVSLGGVTEGASITEPTALTGTATSPNPVSWQLEYRLQGDPTFTPFASGATSAVSGTFDPTLLLNGLYEIRLVATDQFGASASTSVSGIVVQGQAKIGRFSLSFDDVTLPIAGIPMHVSRTYDSRDKGSHDFGFGWSLSLASLRLQTNGVLGTSFVGTSSGGAFPEFCIELNHPAVVTITFPDNTVEQFVPSVTPRCQSGFLGPPQVVNLTFQRVAGTGTTGALEQLDAGDLLVVGQFPGPLQLLDVNGNGVSPVDPQNFAYTTKTGQVLTIGHQSGLQRIATPDGHSVTLTADGLIASNGQDIPFTRDAQGRITAISDPAGRSLRYTYDPSGNLSSVIDQESNVTAFSYDGSHDLLDVVDPRGVRALRSTYDGSGRLVSTTDANGNAVTLTHNPGSKTEVVTDGLGNATTYVYDARGNILQEIDALGHTTTRTYDAENNKLSETDALGNTTSYIYDVNSNKLSQTDPIGNRTSITYNDFSEPLTVTDALGHTSVATYDANGHLLTLTDALGNLTRETHDGHGNALTKTDALGNITSYSYDSHGNAISTTDPLGNVINRTFDANNNALSDTTTRVVNGAADAVTLTRAYDQRNRIIELTDPEGGVLRRTFTPTGLIGSVTDALGHSTSFTYDAAGRLTTTNYPDETTSVVQYDAAGHKTASTDRAGRTTAYAYDAAGRLTRTTHADGAIETLTHDAANRVIARTNGNGKTTTYTYDAAGRMTTMRDPLGAVTSYTYDAVGRKVSETDPNGHTTSFVYDAAGELVQSVHPDGTIERRAYDAAGKYVATTDAAGNTTRFAYDPDSRLVQVTDALGNAYHFAYDALGNRTSQSDPLGNTTAFSYDRIGRQTSQILPLSQTQASVYDAAGNLLGKTDYNGATTNAAYDALNRLTGLALPDGSSLAFSYFANGALRTVVDTRGTTTFSYDQRDRPILVQNPDDSQIRYTYDGDGNRTSVTTPGGTTSYTYDANDRLIAVTDAQGRQSTLAYDAAGNRTALAYPNGIDTRYTYDTRNQLTALSQTLGSTTLHSYAYTLGPTGNRTRVVENTGRSIGYSYDAAVQLTGETIDDPSAGNTVTTYAYDAAGNRVSQTGPNGATTYAYDPNSRLLSTASTSFTYDNNGNTLSQTVGATTTLFQYDGLNRLTSATTPDGVTTYAYDAAGNRVQSRSPSGMTNYLVDPFGADGLSQVLRETAASGASLAEYTYAGSELLSFTRPTGSSFRLADGQRSTRELTDVTGAVTDSYTYDAFGNLLRRTGATPNNYLYGGQQFDSNAGAYYLRARYYVPTIGRFLTTDPRAGSPKNQKSLQRYAYAANDPVNRWDPSGREDIDEELLGAEIDTAVDAEMSSVNAGEGVQILDELALAETQVAQAEIQLVVESALDFSLDEAEVEFELLPEELASEEVLSESQAEAYEEVLSESDQLRVALARNGIGGIGELTKTTEALELLKALDALFESGL